MSDELAIITSVIQEHHKIREHVRLAGDSINDFEALSNLQRAHAGWTQSSIQTLIATQDKMQQAMSFLEQGLSNHFAFEEKSLPPLFGELLMQALLTEHHNISGQIEKAKTMLASTKLEGLNQPELLSRKSQIQQATSDLCQAIEEHAGHEEIILNMIKKALERTAHK